jgi:hypothetical protein
MAMPNEVSAQRRGAGTSTPKTPTAVKNASTPRASSAELYDQRRFLCIITPARMQRLRQRYSSGEDFTAEGEPEPAVRGAKHVGME